MFLDLLYVATDGGTEKAQTVIMTLNKHFKFHLSEYCFFSENFGAYFTCSVFHVLYFFHRVFFLKKKQLWCLFYLQCI